MIFFDRLKRIVNTGNAIDSEKIIKEIKNYKAVSFDIFDTLLKRSVTEPSDVFGIIEKETGVNEFKHRRIIAEKKARELSNEKEITLWDIYNQFSNLSDTQKNLLIEMELKTEENVLTVNGSILDVYRWCIYNKKMVFITSDMYLPEFFITRVLAKNGISSYSKLYLSSSYKKTKSDGSLFFALLEENNLNANDVIHIGDSREGDYNQPKRIGMNALKIPRFFKKSGYSYKFDDKVKEDFFNSFIYNTEPNSYDDYQKFGYECFGPFLWGYVNWIYRSIKETDIKKVYFLSRDGLIMKKAFDICFSDSDIDSHYIEVSRRSLRVPILWMDCRFETVLNMISPSKLISLNTVFDGVGLSMDDYIELIAANGMQPSDVFDRSYITSNDKLLNLYEQLIPYIIENSKKEYEYIIKYIRQNKLSGKFAIVDIGWSGGMQRYLEQTLSKLDISHEVVGFYTGVAAYYKRNAEVLPEINLNGYVFDFKNYKHAKDIRNGFVGLFESLFLEQGGSVKNYYEDGDSVKAARYDYEYIVNGKPTDEYLKIKAIQEAALQFVKNASYNKLLGRLSFSSEELFSGIHQVGAKPNKKAIELFADFNFYDEGETQKLAAPKGLLYYILHIKDFKKDFLKSRWKIGFLKKMLKINLPYEKVYELMHRFK